MTYCLSQVLGFSARCGEPSTPVLVRREVPVRTARVHGQGVRFCGGCHGVVGG